MSGNSFDQHWRKRAKWLTHALILSGTLNIGLFATFVNFILKEKFNPVALEHRPSDGTHAGRVQESNESLLSTYSTLSYQDLLLRLTNKELVEDGFTKRDLALACLVAFHHFNLERALGGLSLQQRLIPFGNPEGDEKIDLVLFAGLADYQYQAILHYAKTEKWPLTSQGLFYELKVNKIPRDPYLLDAFYLTPEFHSVSLLFSRSGMSVSKDLLVEMLAQGEWRLLSEFASQQRQAQDLSPTRRRDFLLDYVNARAEIAAKLLLDSEEEFILKRLDDPQILVILNLLKENFPTRFIKELLVSPRSDAVLKTSASILYQLSGEAVPEPFDLNEVFKRFLPELAKAVEPVAIITPPVQAAPPPEPKAPPKPRRVHVVQVGDSLWKIARQYRVSIESIMQANRLESERLRPGRQLIIPNSNY